MDEELAQNIINLDMDLIKTKLKDLIAEYEIHALITRIKKIQNAIKITMKENQNFLLKRNQWSDDTLKVELSEKYKKHI